MNWDAALFERSKSPSTRIELLGGRVPVLLVDNLYERPDDLREAALTLPFTRSSLHYPGVLSPIEDSASVKELLAWVRELANRVYLPYAPIEADGVPMTSVREIVTDFAIVDVHPTELTEEQQRPHVDPVPLFGLVYLSREPRGGTLFFEQRHGSGEGGANGYFTHSDASFERIGCIDPVFNRLAIYPGSVPHSGDISGDWIAGEDRYLRPRLTQRLMFAP